MRWRRLIVQAAAAGCLAVGLACGRVVAVAVEVVVEVVVEMVVEVVVEVVPRAPLRQLTETVAPQGLCT